MAKWYVFSKKHTVEDLKKETKVSKGKLRSKAKVLIIDDEDFSIVDSLRDHHFLITKLHDIQDIHQVSEYEIVVCDFRGVGIRLNSKLQGAHLIKEIHNTYPEKYLIGYTAYSYDPGMNSYIKVADDFLKKDADVDKWISILDQAIDSILDPVEKWNKVRSELFQSGTPTTTILELEDHFVRKLLGKKNHLEDVDRFKFLSASGKTIILNLVSSAIFNSLSA